MTHHIFHKYKKTITTLSIITGIAYAGLAVAAPPQTVMYSGTPVTTGAPGKPVIVKFQVKNTGDTTYSGVKVIFHIPEGLNHSKVAPANAEVVDDTVSWVNVPLVPGQSFYPSFTFTIDSGTALKTKLPIWVEVTGQDMEATSKNFSLTAKAPTTVKASTLSSTDISTLFQSVYGRTPTATELTYWLGRRSDKPLSTPLKGAMAYHKALGITH